MEVIEGGRGGGGAAAGGGGVEGREGGRLSCTAAEARRSVEKEAQGHRVVKPGERRQT